MTAERQPGLRLFLDELTDECAILGEALFHVNAERAHELARSLSGGCEILEHLVRAEEMTADAA